MLKRSVKLLKHETKKYFIPSWIKCLIHCWFKQSNLTDSLLKIGGQRTIYWGKSETAVLNTEQR